MTQSVMGNPGTVTVTIDKKELYEIVKIAVYDALSNLDFITPEELKQRETALKELEEGETVKWNDYLKERGLAV